MVLCCTLATLMMQTCQVSTNLTGYLGTSPDLPNLIVVGDSVEEVLAHAPGVARALLETMQEHEMPTPHLAEAPQPWQTQVLVPA